MSPYEMLLDHQAVIRPSLGTAEIQRRRDSLEMAGVDAGAFAAQVVDLHPFRNVSKLLLVHRAVGVSLPSAKHDSHVAIDSRSAYADPTGRGATTIFSSVRLLSEFSALKCHGRSVVFRVWNWLTLNVTTVRSSSGGDRRRLATAAAAKVHKCTVQRIGPLWMTQHREQIAQPAPVQIRSYVPRK